VFGVAGRARAGGVVSRRVVTGTVSGIIPGSVGGG
jgi:hypothetical protein